MQESTSVIGQKQNQIAQALSSKLSDPWQRKRAYVDFTGALFLSDYLTSLGFRINVQRSIFRCPKLYSDFDVVDLYCNSHTLYVLTSYGTDNVRVPIKHKNYGILPEAYVVVNIQIGMQTAEVKGIIAPQDLERGEADGRFLKFNINNLRETDELLVGLKRYAGIRASIGKHLDCMHMFVPYIDGKLGEDEKRKLIGHILTCETCKKKLIEAIEFDEKSRIAVKKKEAAISQNSFSENSSLIQGPPPPPTPIPPPSVGQKPKQKTGDTFIEKTMIKAAKEASNLKGAIDLIYNTTRNTAAENRRGGSSGYRKSGMPLKIKKLISITILLGLFVGLSAIIVFNLPVKDDLPDLEEAARQNEEVYADNYSGVVGADSIDYGINIPNIKSNKNYMTVSKVSWEVPTGTNEDQKRFLQLTGKSIRLNLQNDLLLSNQMALNNSVKFDIRFFRDGSLDEVSVNQSSGNTSIDNIVKQSIENTLYFMRPPRGSFVGKKNGLTLVVEF